MFTGIVEEQGEIVGVTDLADHARRLTVRGAAVLVDSRHGDSISVSGVCLTVVDVREGEFTADVMKQTLDNTTLGTLRAGDPVNLERAARVDARLGGHIVQGHVDAVGVITAIEPSANWTVMRVAVPSGLMRYIVSRGSITIDGTSLTVAEIDDAGYTLTISLIPTTLETTTLGSRRVGDRVNLEVDVLAKYIERLTAASRA